MDTTHLKKFAQTARRKLEQSVTAKLEHLLNFDSALIRENEGALKQLKKEIAKTSPEAVIERVAYTWFNRFCALRFMDVNHYTFVRVVSPPRGGTLPEILQDARLGHIDDHLLPYLDFQQTQDILTGKATSPNPQQEAYSMLLVAVCNYYHQIMPFLFQPIRDYTQLLLPDDLLSPHSFPAQLREALTPETCRDVEVIGWLYQFYNSEKLEKINEDVKKRNIKITTQNLPSVTQFFTPHWIVRYIVENTLGRLWMLNHPTSPLQEKMDYYIPPRTPVSTYLKISSPTELKICDPACGSGHMLVYAFDLLYDIYLEAGFDDIQIPQSILQNNLYGIDLDQRAGELAAFALVMKARRKNRRFLDAPASLNICVLENIPFDQELLENYFNQMGPGLLTPELRTDLGLWENTKTFGSLVQPQMDAQKTAEILDVLEKQNYRVNLIFQDTHRKVLQALRQSSYLRPNYHVVITNPPYMGTRKMNKLIKDFSNKFYPESKYDLFSMFIQRNCTLCKPDGQLGFMTPFVWMYLISYKKLRDHIISHKSITSLVQLSNSGFNGAKVILSVFTLENAYHSDRAGAYIRLSNFRGADSQGPKTLEAIKNPKCGWFYRVPASEFPKIPGSPLAFWVSNRMREIFSKYPPLRDHAKVASGITSGDNELFVRQWYEIDYDSIGLNYRTLEDTLHSRHKWYPYNKGGNYRKWYGNKDHVINWGQNGKEIKKYAVLNNPGRHWSVNLINLGCMLREGMTWSFIGSNFGVRYSEPGHIFDYSGCSLFPPKETQPYFQGLLCSKISNHFFRILCPTQNFQPGTIGKLPVVLDSHQDENQSDSQNGSQNDGLNDELNDELNDKQNDSQNKNPNEQVKQIVEKAIAISKADWNSYETALDFTTLPILREAVRRDTLADTYQELYIQWQARTQELKKLEEKNNRFFIDTYNLQEELTPQIPLKSITLTSNPHYRYGSIKSNTPHEPRLLMDTMTEFISYAVGCMFGRYSLDQPGLILANQDQSYQDYFEKIPNPTFTPDDDNVIPIVEGDWFTDNIAQRFLQFLKITFGQSRYRENLDFIEKAIGQPITRYFLKDFYRQHVRRYKKRPIYWLFSSPNGSFNALVYLHRYRPDTVSVILNDYLRQFRSKLTARLDHLDNITNPGPKKETARILKEIQSLRKTIKELNDWEQDVLYPLATQNIPLDLDDGVKVNYNKLQPALKKIY